MATTNDARSGTLAGTDVGTFGQMLVLKLSRTYALRMASVFMMSLATIWLRTGLMPKWLVVLSYLTAATLMVAADTAMWLSLSFIWVSAMVDLLYASTGRTGRGPATARRPASNLRAIVAIAKNAISTQTR